MPLITAVIAIVAAVLITALIVWNAAISYRKKVVESKIGSAEEKAREIIDEAMKTAEAKKREGLLEVKEEALKNKNELEKESKERRNELQKYEKRVLSCLLYTATGKPLARRQEKIWMTPCLRNFIGSIFCQKRNFGP